MKTALITTTINVPKVLELYRKFAPDDCRFFVAADKKTPMEAYEVCGQVPECEIYSPDAQQLFGYECSEPIGWNTDSRRNIALLEALKWGADIIVSIDDDMIPCNGEWVRPELFEENYDGLQFGEEHGWFDVGRFYFPAAPQRGIAPTQLAWREFSLNPVPVTDKKIGVMQGLILGVPDTDAMTAMTRSPQVSAVNDILRNGFVVHPQAYAVFNSQITAFRRELAPAFAQFYAHQGRNTDIFASMLMRRIMQERGLYTYYGLPMGFHARQPRPLFKDLKAEMFGLEHIASFAEYLAEAPAINKGYQTVTEDCRDLMLNCPIFSDDLKKVAAAWYRDCEKVL